LDTETKLELKMAADKPKVYFYDANHEDALREAAEQGNVAEAEKILRLDIDPSTPDMVCFIHLLGYTTIHKFTDS
jgi:hypothetical protein